MSDSSKLKNDAQVVETQDSPSGQTKSESSGNNISASQKKVSKKRVLLIFLGAVLLIVAGIFGARYGLYALSHESTDNAYVEGHITAISPKVVGHVVKVHVEDNQSVKKGDLLVEIDTRDYETQL